MALLKPALWNECFPIGRAASSTTSNQKTVWWQRTLEANLEPSWPRCGLSYVIPSSAARGARRLVGPGAAILGMHTVSEWDKGARAD